MTLDRIVTILKEYKICVGRCSYIKVEITRIEREIEVIKRDTAETLASPKPRQISDMPRGTQISNPTEKYGGMLADGYKTAEQISLEQKLTELNEEYEDKIQTVNYVNSWMSGLTERERCVIKANVIDSMGWKETVYAYRGKFGEDVSKDTLKRLKDKAMDKICEMAK